MKNYIQISPDYLAGCTAVGGGLALVQELTATLLSRACRIFLVQAYAGGDVPVTKRLFLDSTPPSLTRMLTPPLCQPLADPDGAFRGYELRLGCEWFPHVKLQVIACGEGLCVFSVDTHDLMELTLDHADVPGLAHLQAANRRLKEEIERAWEAEGLRTFKTLLREGMAVPTKDEGLGARD